MVKHTFLEHAFTYKILEILRQHFGDAAYEILETSPILGYLNLKTKAANRGSKARGAFANHYALYVVVEDYIKNGFFDGANKGTYENYEGARFSDLFKRQRELPFGSKLQNHALNSRLNDEFKKFYSTLEKQPIVREVETQRYWIQEDLLQVKLRLENGQEKNFNIAQAIIDIINAYIASKRAAFENFLDTCKQIAELGEKDSEQAKEFILEQLQPNVDARIFEIVSYAILKSKYDSETIWIGKSKDSISEEFLVLYKTGRTNANDGGIDFVMRPLGRFFQVTETIDVNKYFLDIDKIQKFPITFVVKTLETKEDILKKIREQAKSKYKINTVVESYINVIEDIINSTDLANIFSSIIITGKMKNVMDEIIKQSKVEFNYINNDEELE